MLQAPPPDLSELEEQGSDDGIRASQALFLSPLPGPTLLVAFVCLAVFLTPGITLILQRLDLLKGYDSTGGLINLASARAGAHTIPEFTQPRQDSSPISTNPWSESLLSYLALHLPYTSPRPGPPSAALTDSVAECWTFGGDHGQLGIRLAKPSNISEFVLYHPNGALRSSAPAYIVVWGILDGSSNLSQYRNSKIESRLLAKVPHPKARPVLPDNIPHTPLSVFQYDVNSSNRRQHFKVLEEISAHPFQFGLLVVQVYNNWGAAFTQICSVEVS